MPAPTPPQPTPPTGPSGRDPHSHADRAASFDRDAAVYAQVRPTYPREALAWLLPAGARDVLDLAAGTGKLTERAVDLVDNGTHVVAVDPSAAMLAELAARLPGVATHRGTAEAIPLGDASVDAVLVGQAWHWFDGDAAAAEVARVLRPGGTLGVLWNDRDGDVDWVARFGAILHQGDRLEPDPGRPDGPELGAAFDGVEAGTFRWTDRIPAGALRTLAGTRSYLLTLPEAEREERLAEVDALVATHPDLAGRPDVDLPYVTYAYRARRR
ncbi:class I SAM-dependent methyltransferase [Krasilnikoviella flava]|uniref:Methyltransferase domain-containing protein n=1 Tax=Krasilnikoviella flava TaxID=526729 RepID=A0A1T5KQN9_9MICO|nr:methyltransferase domain-containing protein [Krasilnikoviella flava]SKC66007.1 Methyltransferase domain-containing protein [Krasilnikoviella flava]